MSLTMEEKPSDAQNDWVKVDRRKGRRTRPGAMAAPAPAGSVSLSVPVPSTPSLSLEQVKQEHDRISDQWRSSSSYLRLQELLSSHSTSTSVTKAVCFGLGTFDPVDGAWEQKRKAHIQLAAFLTIVDYLRSKEGHAVPCFFQDPVFNSVDKAFIESLGHQVVESPVGFQLVEPSALAFGVHLYRDVYSQIIATHIPAVFIGTAYEVWEE
jgi:hypothetical protein